LDDREDCLVSRRAADAGDWSGSRSDCPIACSLDLIGDRWTLLIVRDLFIGKHRFSEFLNSGEGIKTNILAERLKRLERAGLVERSVYQEHPPRYEYHLTESGRELSTVVKAIYAWGRAHRPGVERSRPTRRKQSRD
jgi:DNA-binding HxlR family transcriptional regulator